MKIIEEQGIDIVLIQEPYVLNNQPARISRQFKIFTHGENRKRAAVLIANNQIDAILINQISNEDAAVVELTLGTLRFYAVSMYLDIERDINVDLAKMDNILSFTRGDGLLIAMDSNARSTMWHDTVRTQRKRKNS